MYLIYLFLAFFHPTTSDADFCSCMNPGEITQGQVDGYDYIARGQVVSVEVRDYTRFIKVKVGKMYKSNTSGDTITISTPRSSAACGLSAQEGQEWLFYGGKEDGSYTTDLCTRSAVISQDYPNDRVVNDIKFLDSMTQPKTTCGNGK